MFFGGFFLQNSQEKIRIKAIYLFVFGNTCFENAFAEIGHLVVNENECQNFIDVVVDRKLNLQIVNVLSKKAEIN